MDADRFLDDRQKQQGELQTAQVPAEHKGLGTAGAFLHLTSTTALRLPQERAEKAG